MLLIVLAVLPLVDAKSVPLALSPLNTFQLFVPHHPYINPSLYDVNELAANIASHPNILLEFTYSAIATGLAHWTGLVGQ
ncbi:hypothetical protein SAMN05216324_10929 [Chryseobacterium limigenitum]|uniref:Uncharacterized protein n=1 Tax=Chryseobacterium limigenitum TaxID=1612149 RepID=A0A1K2ISN3_9FLAO|nr:hypothetical protein SAMN05216324_10929 [Chryseobacterium limigenitum]